jgi:transcriptional regulator with XRE-family HTH domain
MLSLKNETDVIREARTLIRANRMALSWRQADLAKRSGVGVATIRRFESTGRIGFVGLAKLLATLGLADHFLSALKHPPISPKNINEFLAGGPSPVRQRAPRRTGGK